jgi:GPH family glycoside/pentoside/hexuronide:cation symporter
MIDRRTKLYYGAGGAVYAVKEAAYLMFVLLFYTQVLGLDGTITGIIIAISLVWDAVSDPLVGALSDRYHSRFGRRHPFMVASILPLGLGFLGLFAPPAAVVGEKWLLASWLLFWSLWVRTFITTFSIPHLALSTDLAEDYQQRSEVLGSRMAFIFLTTVLLPATALLFIFTGDGDSDGRFIAGNYPLYGALSCALVWFLATISCAGTRHLARPTSTAGNTAPPTASLVELTHDLARTLKNRSFRLLIGYEIGIMMAYGVLSTLNMLLWTYVWEFSPVQVSLVLALPSLLAVVLVLVTLPWLGRRLHKCQQLRLALVVLLANCLWLYPMKVMGLLPGNDTTAVFALNFLFMLVFMYMFMLRAINTQSIVADITDEHELETGLRQEGGFYSAINFIAKLAAVFGPAYSGIALDVIGLPTGAEPGEVSAAVLDGLVYAAGLGFIPTLCFAIWMALRIDMRREKVEHVQAALRQRRSEDAAVAGVDTLGHNPRPTT